MKKSFERRAPDHSRAIRRTIQGLFLGLNLWIGVEFYQFVRFYETGGATPFVARPAGVEGWLPIAGLMKLRLWLGTGDIPELHAAGLFLMVAFLAMSLVFRKSFCSWLCPVGTVSEYLWRVGRETFRRNWRLPRWADLPLRSLKYILLGLFVYAIATMSVRATQEFLASPYGLVADVKMLNFFRYLSVTAAVTLGVIALLSFFLQNFWCRYLCPYGALMGLVAMVGVSRIRRQPELCIDCARCAKACPSLIPVDQLITVKTAECLGCYECVAACPAQGALHMSLPGRRRLPAWAMAAGLAAIFLGLVGYAKWTGYWETHLPSSVYSEWIPRAGELAHP